MLKYTYGPGKYTFALRNTIPINLDMPDGKFCPMGNEFIFYSLYANKLHGEPTYWSGAKYDYGLDE